MCSVRDIAIDGGRGVVYRLLPGCFPQAPAVGAVTALATLVHRRRPTSFRIRPSERKHEGHPPAAVVVALEPRSRIRGAGDALYERSVSATASQPVQVAVDG
jgi:hypothetical protein